MKTVPLETIDRIWKRMSRFNLRQIENLGQQFTRRQPFLAGFLAPFDRKLESQSLFIWSALKPAQDPEEIVPLELIHQTEWLNVQWMKNLEGESPSTHAEAAVACAMEHNQAPLMQRIVALVWGSEEPLISAEEVTREFLVLKTVVDCLDQRG